MIENEHEHEHDHDHAEDDRGGLENEEEEEHTIYKKQNQNHTRNISTASSFSSNDEDGNGTSGQHLDHDADEDADDDEDDTVEETVVLVNATVKAPLHTEAKRALTLIHYANSCVMMFDCETGKLLTCSPSAPTFYMRYYPKQFEEDMDEFAKVTLEQLFAASEVGSFFG